MTKMLCGVKNCKGTALVAYGNKWICGECFMKIQNNKIAKQNKEIEELENAD